MGVVKSSVYGTFNANVGEATVDGAEAVSDNGALTSSQAGALTSSQEVTADAATLLVEVIPLANSLKAKYNQAQTDLATVRTKYNQAQADIAALRTTVNSLMASLRSAGLLDS